MTAAPSVDALPGTLEESQVRAMFDRIAGVYDRMNGVMTAGLHHGWRQRAAAYFGWMSAFWGLARR